MSKYVILGVHDEKVSNTEKISVLKADGSTLVVGVARVRMYIGPKEDREFDEDFQLPEIPKGVIPETVEVYSWLLAKDIKARMAVLEAALPAEIIKNV